MRTSFVSGWQDGTDEEPDGEMCMKELLHTLNRWRKKKGSGIGKPGLEPSEDISSNIFWPDGILMEREEVEKCRKHDMLLLFGMAKIDLQRELSVWMLYERGRWPGPDELEAIMSSTWMYTFAHPTESYIQEPEVNWGNDKDVNHPCWPSGILMTSSEYELCKAHQAPILRVRDFYEKVGNMGILMFYSTVIAWVDLGPLGQNCLFYGPPVQLTSLSQEVQPRRSLLVFTGDDLAAESFSSCQRTISGYDVRVVPLTCANIVEKTVAMAIEQSAQFIVSVVSSHGFENKFGQIFVANRKQTCRDEMCSECRAGHKYLMLNQLLRKLDRFAEEVPIVLTSLACRTMMSGNLPLLKRPSRIPVIFSVDRSEKYFLSATPIEQCHFHRILQQFDTSRTLREALSKMRNLVTRVNTAEGEVRLRADVLEPDVESLYSLPI